MVRLCRSVRIEREKQVPYTDNPDYDPDSPPADSGGGGFLYRLEKSVRVDSQIDADLFGADVGGGYKFFTTPGDFEAHADGSPAWVLVWKSIDAVREDGGIPTYTETLALKTRSGEKWLGEGQAPDKLAKQFASLGVTASWNKAGQPDSAVGRVFNVQTKHRVELFKRGKDVIAKTFRVWPVAIQPIDYVFDGEVRTLGSSTASEAEASPAIPTPSTVTLRDVAQLLNGIPTSKAIDTLLDASIPGIVEGVAVLDAAFKGPFELATAMGAYVSIDNGAFLSTV